MVLYEQSKGVINSQYEFDNSFISNDELVIKLNDNDNDNNSAMCICAYLTLVIVILIFMIIVKNSSNRSRMENKEQQIMYFTRQGCPHCINFNPIWDSFVQKSENDNYIKTNFILRKIDCNDPKSSVLYDNERQYGLSSVPHVVRIMADGSRKIFKSERTVDNLIAFAH